MNPISRRRKAPISPIGPIPRERPVYHRDNIARGLPLVHFLNPSHISSMPSKAEESLKFRLLLGKEAVQNRSAKTVRFHHSISRLDRDTSLSGCQAQATRSYTLVAPCENDMIAAHVENLMGSKLPTGLPQSLGKVFDFTTIIWITASQLPTFSQGLRLLIFDLMKKSSNFEPSLVDSKLPL